VLIYFHVPWPNRKSKENSHCLVMQLPIPIVVTEKLLCRGRVTTLENGERLPLQAKEVQRDLEV
jgi:hypothetical protein